MKNIHLIPTDKPSRLFLNKVNNKLLLDSDTYCDLIKRLPSSNYQNICITSDETIKEGDWVVTNGGIRFVTSINNDKSKTFTDDGSISKKSPSPYCDLEYYKKIILTTDQNLIKNGVQAIDDEFLEWFVKNPSCEEVEVKFNNRGITGTEKILKTFGEYKIIISQEQQMAHNGLNGLTQETLKEAAERLSELQEGTYTIQHKTTYQHGFIDGAKYQAERMYSEEEVIAILYQQLKALDFYGIDFKSGDWFEQFKKK